MKEIEETDRENKTVLTLTQYGNEMRWTGSEDAGLDDIMAGFLGCLRGITFGDWCIRYIRDWCNEQLGDEEKKEEA